MHTSQHNSARLIERILHPTDFSETSLTAFQHALKAALIANARLHLLHVTSGHSTDFMDFPGVRETLERWGLIPKDSPRSAVPELGIGVRKVIVRDRDPVDAVLHYMESHPIDLVVLATHRHEGRVAWLNQSVSRPIARRSEEMTLFIPDGQAGFVSAATGAISLKNILIPLAESPAAQPAVDAAARLASRLQCPSGTFTLLHVGEKNAMPEVECPEVPGWEWSKVARSGDVIHGIIDAAEECHADVVVMSTDGRNGFLDAFRGSHTERVLQHAHAPLLAVPAS